MYDIKDVFNYVRQLIFSTSFDRSNINSLKYIQIVKSRPKGDLPFLFKAE